jgi:hypothetical protein
LAVFRLIHFELNVLSSAASKRSCELTGTKCRPDFRVDI